MPATSQLTTNGQQSSGRIERSSRRSTAPQSPLAYLGMMVPWSWASRGGSFFRWCEPENRCRALAAWVAAVVLLLALGVVGGRVVGEPPMAGRGGRHGIIAGPRQLLAMLGMTDEDWTSWRDERPLGEAEKSLLLETVFRLSRFHPAEWELWEQPVSQFDRVWSDIDRYRGEVIGLDGTIESYSRLAVSDELRERYELGEVFAVRILTGRGGERRIIELIVPRLPASWGTGLAVGQPVRARGICLKRLQVSQAGGRDGRRGDQRGEESSADSTRGLLMVGPSILWYPDRPDRSLRVARDHLDLVRAGFSLELLDDARRTDGRGLLQADRECFFQMLRAVAKVSVGKDRAPSIDSLFPLLRDPQGSIGRRVRLRGRTRRVAKVMVLDPRDRRRLGFDYYFQIDLFIDLKGARIEIHPPKQDGKEVEAEPVILANVYPVTLCVLELPASLDDELGGNPSANVRMPVEVDGYLMKSWAYHSPIMARFGGESRQRVPLIMVADIRPLEFTPDGRVGIWLAGLFIVGLGSLWVWVWRTGRADRAARQRIQDRLRNSD